MKVRLAERQHVENKPRLLESTMGRVVSLFPIAPAHAFGKLEASVDKLFDEGASGDGQGADIQPVVVTTDTIVEDVAPLQPRRQRKRETVVANDGGLSHPPKKLREDYGALVGASTAGKSMFAVQSLFTGVVLNAEARGEPIPTLPFVTSSVSATPEHSSHHFGANIPKTEVDFIVRSSAPAIAIVNTVTTAIDSDATAARAHVAPSLFGVGSSLTGRTDSVPGGFSDVSGSDFLIGGIRTMLDGIDHGHLFTKFNIRAARPISLNAEVRMQADNIREKRKLRAVVDEQAELLKVKDGEIESLKAQLLLKEAEAKEKNELSVKVTDLSASIKVREHEVADLDAYVTAVKLQNDNLMGQISSAGLQEKVAAYGDFVSQLEKFQDEKLEEVNEKFDKLCADFVDMALHLEEKFYPHLLITISGRRWLLTYGMELAVIKCLNSTEYLFTLGAAISKAVEKVCRKDYLLGLPMVRKNVNFSLIAKLKSNKDASVDTIMNLLRLDDVLAERLGLIESQPHVNQLMVPIHHSPDQRVVALHGVFVPLSEFLSALALERMEGTSGSTHDATTTLSTTFVFASNISPISTDDSKVAHADGQGGVGVDYKTAAIDNMNLFLMLAMHN
nr:hypothetical protein [Tanacetum cinerariifolium]GEW48202.1 hypothetical protein [Tanacetum cinerariifolium]